MRSYFTLLAMIIAITCTKAQNIVPNSNFALRDTCPDDISQVHRCTYWRPLTASTPDYYHVCATDAALRVPSNWFGYQNSSSGAYVGLYTYTFIPYHEYIATNIPPMVVGSTYKVSIKISLADGMHYASEPPQVYFYKNAVPDSTNLTVLVLTPQVSFASYGIVHDTSWVMLSRTFIADSAYTHLAVGNFKADAATTWDSTGPGIRQGAYYYIDSVAVERMNTQSLPEEPASAAATLYPNPISGNGVLSFANPDRHACILYIFDISGRLVKKEEGITGESVAIDGKALGSGSYYYKITGGDVPVWGRMLVE